MPWWWKFYARDEADDQGKDLGGGGETGGGADGGDDGGGGGDVGAGESGTADDGGTGSGGAGAGAGDDAKPKTDAELREGMLGAITEGLKAGDEPADKQQPKHPDTDAAGKDPAGDEKPATGEEKKPAKADDFQLTAEEKKALSPRAIGRFHELHKHAKAVEAEVATLRETNTGLAQARDTIVGLLKETQTSSEELAQYLDFNLMMKSGRFDDALKIVDEYRTALLKQLGRAAPGYDPLNEHDDLRKKVEDGDMDQAAALEVVQARTVRAQAERRAQQEAEAMRASAGAEQATQSALQAIGAWNQNMARSDPAFEAKAAILAPRLKGLMSRYPATLWPQVIQDAYEAITVPAAGAAQAGGGGTGMPRPAGDQTLRPRSGSRPGAPAPKDMLDAITQGLGYSQ